MPDTHLDTLHWLQKGPGLRQGCAPYPVRYLSPRRNAGSEAKGQAPG